MVEYNKDLSLEEAKVKLEKNETPDQAQVEEEEQIEEIDEIQD
jgi:hypothetical protein